MAILGEKELTAENAEIAEIFLITDCADGADFFIATGRKIFQTLINLPKRWRASFGLAKGKTTTDYTD
jgi:hypothetical protein